MLSSTRLETFSGVKRGTNCFAVMSIAVISSADVFCLKHLLLIEK